MSFFRNYILILLIAAGLTFQAANAEDAQSEFAAYVLLGPDGAQIARVVTPSPSCPTVVIDGKTTAMVQRNPAETVPQRVTVSTAALSKPSVFSAQTCEAVLPQHAIWAEIGGVALKLAPKVINRIVVIGDTGCRIKAADNAAQKCNDADAFPFRKVAAAAAAWKPDIVLHVGDYLYRENPCPEAASGCEGSPWGYGLDSWNADFFMPAEPLLRAAPWVMVRGNHESCNRAGQGWQRFFDAYPFSGARSCDDPKNDMTGDFTPPFAIPLGRDAQIIVWDTSITPGKHFAADDPRMAILSDNFREIGQLALRAHHNILANHQPPMAFAAWREKGGEVKMVPGTLSLQDVMLKADPNLVPANIDLLLSGHIHLWEQLSFGGRYPSQIVAGFSGTLEDIVPMPEKLPADAQPAPGATVEAFSSWIDGFGFMTLERQGDANWRAEIHDKTGTVVNRCEIRGRLSHCDTPQVHAS